MRIACEILLWNKTASLRDIEVKYRPEPTSACFIPRVRLQFRKSEPRIRRLSWRQLLDVPLMQELAIMRRLTTAVLFIALNLFPPVALTQTKLPDQSQSPGAAKQQVASRDRVLISEQLGPALSRLPYSFMYPYRGAICFELFRDFITLPGEMKCLESRWRKLPP
jgi:hypothetical protein